MFTLAHLSMLQLEENRRAGVGNLELLRQFDHACLSLTQGQNLDIAFETRSAVSSSDYMVMIDGKTAALLAAATAIGAQIGLAQESQVENYRKFGRHLGLAFQILDDILGIWGKPARTGKSDKDDIRSRKKTLPVLYAMEGSSEFTDLWNRSGQDHTADIIAALENAGAREYSYTLAKEHTRLALGALEAASPRGTAGDALRNLADELFSRDQ
jgi:geranylgeranyl diphosphate synthase type I